MSAMLPKIGQGYESEYVKKVHADQLTMMQAANIEMMADLGMGMTRKGGSMFPASMSPGVRSPNAPIARARLQ